jgi:tetratricopeptide (TPR) repeat protein
MVDELKPTAGRSFEIGNVGPGAPYDFFLSRRGSIAAVAREVADILEAEHYRVVVQDYDFASSGQFVLDINRALTEARHLLILYSHDYHSSFWTQQEFANFLAAAPASVPQRRIGVLRCDDSIPQGLLAGITFGDLSGVTDPAERRRIILAVARGEAPAARMRPRVVGGTMPARNLLFTGRAALLAALHTALTEGSEPTALTQAAVHGLGGVGKTSLAREYVARHDADYRGGVWWITAADRLGTVNGLAALAHALNPRLSPDLPSEDAAQVALADLAGRSEPFLLVYDNAPDPSVLTSLLPQAGARVLITSRQPDWSLQAQELPVAVMAEDEAVELLRRRAGQEVAPGARRLAEELGYLPLALEQAAAYAKATLTSFDDYARQIERLIHRAGRNPDYPASVGATFEVAIGRAGPVAEAILARLAWYAPERIPLLLLDDSVASDEDRTEGLAALTGVSLITADPTVEGSPTVSVHRLVQAVMRHRLAQQGNDAASREAAVERLTATFSFAFNEPLKWTLWRRLLPHQTALAARVPPDKETAVLTSLLDRTGSFLQDSGDARAALPLKRRALEGRERVLGPDHPDTLVSVNNLAGCLNELGDAAAAMPLYRRAVEGNERDLGPDHPDTLTCVSNLAGGLDALGDAAAALPLYRRALEGRERGLGSDHPDTLVSLNNLAQCLQALGDAAAALALYHRALEGTERVLDPDHPTTLIIVNNLALCLQTLGDAAAALPLNRRVLEGSERVLGPDHRDTLQKVNNLAASVSSAQTIRKLWPA